MMLETGFLAGLIAKLAGLGTAAKAAIATLTAAVTMTVAGGAAGVLPLPGGGGGSGSDVVRPATETVDEAVDATAETMTGETEVNAGAQVSTTTPGATGSAGADLNASVETPSTTADAASVPEAVVPGVTLPDLSGLAEVPDQVMQCLEPVFDLVAQLPMVSPSQVTQIGPGIVSCVTGIVSNLPLPSGLDTCISEIMGFVGGMTSMSAGMPNFGGFDIASCIPAGLPVPGLPSGLPFMGGGFPFQFPFQQ